MVTSFFLLLTMQSFSQLIQKTRQELMTNYHEARYDTNKVRILLAIDSFYLYQMPDTEPILDSAVLMAKQAQNMSRVLHFQRGWDDATFLMANSLAEKKAMGAASAIADSVEGPLSIRIFIMLGERYLFRPGELKENIDSALFYITRAEKLSDSIHSRYWLYQSLCLKGKYYFTSGELERGKSCFEKMIEECRRNKRVAEQAHWHAELGRFMPHTDSTYDDVLINLNYALELYHKLDDKVNEVESLEALAFLHKLRTKNIGLAELELQRVIKLRKKFPTQKLFLDYSELSEINVLQGNYNIALSSAQSAVSNMEDMHHDDFSGGIVYSQMAKVYEALGDVNNSLLYFRKALDHLVDSRNEYLFAIGGKIVESLLKKDDARQALLFIENFARINPPQRIIDKEILAACMGSCYAALKKNDAAERSFISMIELDARRQVQMAKQVVGERSNTITGSEAYYLIGNFYINKQQFIPAKTYLLKAIAFKQFAPSFERQIDIHLLLFKADSAQGDYISAIKHFQAQQQLRDSLFTDRKAQQIAELQIQYATDKNEKDLQLYRANEQAKDKELKSNTQFRFFTYSLILILLVLIIVGHSRYSQKHRSSKKLETQQGLIDRKNCQLQKVLNDKDKLLYDKDKLLAEKEQLIREIHHRVKNNLQIVISLLNTQSKYLNSEEAVHAITESRHRMQAMSLVHEMLYQSEDTSSVNMHKYITELVEHLKNSFDISDQMLFVVDVAAIELELAQAIPLGLILNEVFTNAIKYAFAGTPVGRIYVCMETCSDESISLVISDNGVGLPVGVDISKTRSMGMRLVTGLAKQLNAELTINNENGVSVSLQFKAEKNARDPSATRIA